MGIKENFTQAVKELTGTGKTQPDTIKTAQVEDLRRAVEAEAAEIPSAPLSVTPVEPAPITPVNIQQTPLSQVLSTAPQPAPVSNINPHELRQTASPVQTSPLVSAPIPSSNPAAGNMFGDFNANSPVTANAPAAIPSRISDDGTGEELTVISKNTIIEGNIRSFANMNVEGNVRGDIETTKNVELNGKIVGNLTCNNANMLTSQIQGNIRMKGNIVMGRDTLLIGDLVSTYAKVNGKIKGNLEVGGKVEFKGDSVVFGDISASTITVDDGAIIQGYVSTTFLNKEESKSIFPEAISIAE